MVFRLNKVSAILPHHARSITEVASSQSKLQNDSVGFFAIQNRDSTWDVYGKDGKRLASGAIDVKLSPTGFAVQYTDGLWVAHLWKSYPEQAQWYINQGGYDVQLSEKFCAVLFRYFVDKDDDSVEEVYTWTIFATQTDWKLEGVTNLKIVGDYLLTESPYGGWNVYNEEGTMLTREARGFLFSNKSETLGEKPKLVLDRPEIPKTRVF